MDKKISLLEPSDVLKAYKVGIFPMGDEKNINNIFWIEPEWRGILPLNNIHISKSLKKKIKKNPYEIRFDYKFNDVINACAKINNKRKETWINESIIKCYSRLFEMGFAHSIEAWKENSLVGGLYGVSINSAFFGESMFSTEKDSSKISLIYLIYILKKLNFYLFDVQFKTEYLSQFGVIEIHKKKYKYFLNDAIRKKNTYSPPLSVLDSDKVLQSITQTS